MVESGREVCGLVTVEGGNSKSVWWNNQEKAAVKRKEAAWREVLRARDEYAKKKKFGSL